MTPRPQKTALAIGLGFSILTPVVVAALLLSASPSPVNDTSDGKNVVTVSESLEWITAGAELALTVESPMSLPLTHAGTVTSIYIQEGESIHSGDRILAIDGIDRIAYVPQPGMVFYRSLCEGTRGADVEALQQILIATGLTDSTPDGRFGQDTSRAVRKLNETVGFSTPSGCFEPWLAVPIPADGTVVTSTTFTLGGPASDAEPWATFESRVTSASTRITSGTSIPDGTYELAVNGHHFSTTVIGGEVQVANLAELSVLASNQGVDTFTGSLKSTDSFRVILVPASALVIYQGSTCIALTSGDGAYEFVSVERVPIGVRDVVAIQPDPALAGREVLVTPGASGLAVTCA